MNSFSPLKGQLNEIKKFTQQTNHLWKSIFLSQNKYIINYQSINHQYNRPLETQFFNPPPRPIILHQKRCSSIVWITNRIWCICYNKDIVQDKWNRSKDLNNEIEPTIEFNTWELRNVHFVKSFVWITWISGFLIITRILKFYKLLSETWLKLEEKGPMVWKWMKGIQFQIWFMDVHANLRLRLKWTKTVF